MTQPPRLAAVRLRQFKCFSDQRVDFAGLTVLAGMNGVGKSTVIQSLLLIRQSHTQGLLRAGRLSLNGDLTSVGTSQDALRADGQDQIGIELMWDDSTSMGWIFAHENDGRILRSVPGTPVPDSSDGHALFDDRFHYLNAERLSPKAVFPIASRETDGLGRHGQFTAHFLDRNRHSRIACPALHARRVVSSTLLSQTSEWLTLLCSNEGLDFEGIGTPVRTSEEGDGPLTDVAIRLDIDDQAARTDVLALRFEFFRPGDLPTGPFRPTNVGFGLTYALPIVVALLTTPPGGMVLIENPEAHLHPAGQSKIGQLCCLAAAQGVQVVLETHSDHVINGIRRAVRKGAIEAASVQLHFFQRSQDGTGSPKMLSPRVNERGRLDRWPEGFFDEWDRALDELMED